MCGSSFNNCTTVLRWGDGFDTTADASLALVDGNIEGGEWPGELVEMESDAGADDGDTGWIVLALLRRRGLWACERGLALIRGDVKLSERRNDESGI
jgi:hypothetical protein